MAAQWFWTIPPIPWLRDKELGLGQVVDQTTHLTDLCLLFAGPAAEVYAAYTLNTFSDLEFHNWDGFSLAWKHAAGAVGTLQGTYALFPTIGQYEPPSVKLIARELLLRITPDGLAVITPEGQQRLPQLRAAAPQHQRGVRVGGGAGQRGAHPLRRVGDARQPGVHAGSQRIGPHRPADQSQPVHRAGTLIPAPTYQLPIYQGDNT